VQTGERKFEIRRISTKRDGCEDGGVYAFISGQVLALDKLNSQIASRLVRTLMNRRRIEPERSAMMRNQLQRIANADGLSGNVYEIISKSLA